MERLKPQDHGYPPRIRFEGLPGLREYRLGAFRTPRKGEYCLSRDMRRAYRVPCEGCMSCRIVRPIKAVS